MSGTKVDTERLRALLAASTPGPWELTTEVTGGVMPTDLGDEPWSQVTWALSPPDADPDVEYALAGIDDRSPEQTATDLRFVAEALTALPGLLDEVERQRRDRAFWASMAADLNGYLRDLILDVLNAFARQGDPLRPVLDLAGTMDLHLDDEVVDAVKRALAVRQATPDPEGVS